MADNAKLQRRYDALVADFVSPLLTGGTVMLDRALAPGSISYFEHANTGDAHANREIFDALHREASTIAMVETVPWPDRDLLLIAMAAHNLVLVTDPKMDRMFARGGRRKIAAWIDETIDAIVPPNTRADALSRHALLDRFPDLKRKDITAKSWAYTYRFIGRPTNDSLLTRPMFAKFRETETLVDVQSLLRRTDEDDPTLELSDKLRRLLARSPVTELLRLDLCESFRFGLSTLAVLSDDAVRGGVAREIVARGEFAAAPRLGKALGDPILQHAPPAHLYFAVQLCFEVQMTATLDVPGPALPQRLDLSDRDVARYAAVLPAYFEDDSMIDEVRAFDDSDRGVVQERCARIAAALPEGVMDEIAPLVRRCQRPGAAAQPSARELRT